MPAHKPGAAAAKTRRRKRSKTTTRRRRRRRSGSSGILATVQAAREAAAGALRALRREIQATRGRLERLVESDRSFQLELFGGHRAPKSPRARAARKPRRKGPPRAEKFYKALPPTFTLEDVRKVAGRLTGVSLAQWGRAKRIRKIGKGKYRKAA
ncbi:MAG: hypothetical protein ACREQ9_01520 [Candidatus Binatia bacterium]